MGDPTLFNGKIYFVDEGVNPPTGSVLWSTDGATAGTTIVAGINPGDSSYDPSSLVVTPGALTSPPRTQPIIQNFGESIRRLQH